MLDTWFDLQMTYEQDRAWQSYLCRRCSVDVSPLRQSAVHWWSVIINLLRGCQRYNCVGWGQVSDHYLDATISPATAALLILLLLIARYFASNCMDNISKCPSGLLKIIIIDIRGHLFSKLILSVYIYTLVDLNIIL